MILRYLHATIVGTALCFAALAAYGSADVANAESSTPHAASTVSMVASANPNQGPNGTLVPSPVAAATLPVVFNATTSARVGDVVGLQGENFGESASVVLITPIGQQPLEVLEQFGGGWVSFRIPNSAQGFLAVKVITPAGESKAIGLNGATPFHLDTTTLVPNGAFRVIGRNLRLKGYMPRVVVNGLDASVDLARSTEHMLWVTAPKALNNGPATIDVSNGSGDGLARLDRNVHIVSQGKGDPFGLGVGWGALFSEISRVVLDPTSSQQISRKAKCDGMWDDSDALNEASRHLEKIGGGVIRLPVGTCYLAKSVSLGNRVVIEGAGQDSTVVDYDANDAIFGRDVVLAGIRNLTLRNRGKAFKGPLLTGSRHVFMQGLTIELGRSEQMWFADNSNFVFRNCTIHLQESTNAHGPYIFNGTSGLVFEENITRFATGTTTFESVHDSVLYQNRFIRDAANQHSDKSTVHTIAIDFAHRLAIVENSLEVVNGPLLNKRRNDGEALLTEGGGALRTENLGVVEAADDTSITDAANAIRIESIHGRSALPENYGVAIVHGKGAGQTRKIIEYKNGKITVDKPWDSIPDRSSHYATFVWGLERVILAGNVLNHNPRGIWLYQTSLREVDVIGNQIREGGGIYLRSAQKISDRLFTPQYMVRIAGNKIVNTTGNWGSYLNMLFIGMDPDYFGIGSIALEMRDNDITANRVNARNSGEDHSSNEGIIIEARTESPTRSPLNSQIRILGTIVQGNMCSYCPPPKVGAGTRGTYVDLP